MMESREAGVDAAEALAGRFYGGRLVRVAYIPEVDYVQLYPEAARMAELQAEKALRRARRREQRKAEEAARRGAGGSDARRPGAGPSAGPGARAHGAGYGREGSARRGRDEDRRW